MNSASRCWLLAASFIPVLGRAQTIQPTQVTVRLFEQPSGLVLSPEKRIYTYYFNTLRTRWIGVEVSLEYAKAPESFQLSIGCQLTRPDGKATAGVWKIGMTIPAGSTSAVGANYMFGSGRDGWQSGVHKVTCASTQPLGETTLQMSPGPSLLADTELRLKDVRFFSSGAQVPPAAQRKYEDRFLVAETTRIGIELSFVHPGLSRISEFPIDCYFLASTGRVLGVLNLSYELTPPATSGSAAMGLGWDQPGQWPKGDFLAICQIHGRPISVDRFTVR